MAKRGRHKKIRYIQKMPEISQFSPRGKPGRPDEIELKIDEFEAFNLADGKGYSQAEGAEIMGISRASFGRILRSARQIVATALVEGKIIRIRTSDVQVGVTRRPVPKKSDLRTAAAAAAQEEDLRKTILHHDLTPTEENESK